MILIPIILSLLFALAIVIIRINRPQFRFFWIIAVVGSLSSFILVVLSYFRLPLILTLPSWKGISEELFTPTLIVNESIWPIALSLSSLGLAAIFTSTIRDKSNPLEWATIMAQISIGLIAISSGNYITMAISWICIDLIDFTILIRNLTKDKSNRFILLFTLKLGGILLLLWAAIISTANGKPMSFNNIPSEACLLLFLSSLLRIGFLPTDLPGNNPRQSRGLFTVSNIVSIVSGLAILMYIPSNLINKINISFLLIAIGILVIGLSFIWFFSKDVLAGRPYWILTFGLFTITSALLGNRLGTESLMISIILCGGLVYFYTFRTKKNRWIPLIGIWGLSALPFSLNFSFISHINTINEYASIPVVIGYSLLLAGYVKHSYSYQPNISSENNQRWEKVIYSTGLAILLVLIIYLGLFDLNTFKDILFSWKEVTPIGFAVIIIILYFNFHNRLSKIKIQIPSIKKNYLSTALWGIYYSIRRLIQLINSILEGDGGMLWSLVILLLFITIISSFSQ